MTDAEVLAALRTLAAWLAPVLRSTAPTSAPTFYTSDAPPLGLSRRAFNARCARIPEARKDGRIWRVTVDAYQRSLTRPQSRAKVKAPTPPPTPVDSVEAILAQRGVRLRTPRDAR